jgi:amidase
VARLRAAGAVAVGIIDNFRAVLAGYFSNLDPLVTPTLAAPPVEAARCGQRSWPRVFAANARYAPYSAPWNHAGYPAVSVPAGMHPRTGMARVTPPVSPAMRLA